MLAWIALLFLIVVEVIAIRWWLTARFISLFFNDWALFLYSLLFLVDIIIGWLISMTYQAGGTPGMQIMLVVGIAISVILALGTLFLGWVIHFDLHDIGSSKKDK
jgi:hypothetical protein